MQLPNKVYEPDVRVHEVSFLPRKNSTDRSLKTVTFPKWLIQGIAEIELRAYKQGYEAALERLRSVIGVH